LARGVKRGPGAREGREPGAGGAGRRQLGRSGAGHPGPVIGAEYIQ